MVPGEPTPRGAARIQNPAYQPSAFFYIEGEPMFGWSDGRYSLSGRRRALSRRILSVAAFAAVVASVVFLVVFVRRNYSGVPSVSSLERAWAAGDYQAVYDRSEIILQRRPLDGTALAWRGFAAYYLYAEKNDPAQAQTYLVECVTSLRNALYRVSAQSRPEIAYVLGKAYYQRGYYYADLAMKYLDEAHEAGLDHPDLAEFRALAASYLGDYKTSVEAFTEALSSNPSDLLLHALARSYAGLGDQDRAKQYLSRAISETGDELLRLRCRYELGSILLAEGKVAEAESEFAAILEKDPNSADAHYGLGVIYENQGDLIKARSEWRKAIRANPVHAGARQKLNL